MSVFRPTYMSMLLNYSQYCDNCNELVKQLNETFYKGKEEKILDIIWQPSDGFVIVWGEDNNTYLDMDIIDELETEEDFENYLRENSI